MPRSQITESWKKAEAMVFHVQENLNADEYAVFLDMIDPLPEPEPEVKPAKKARKKSASKKSSRASSLEQQIKANTAHVTASSRSSYCYATVDDNGGEMTCGKPEDNPVHDMTYLSSHPFVRDARPASDQSSANDGAGGGAQNSKTQPEDVSSVHHAGG